MVAYRYWVRVCRIEFENFCTGWSFRVIESSSVIKLQFNPNNKSWLLRESLFGTWQCNYFEQITPFFTQHFLTSKLLSHAFPKSPILCKDKLVEGTKLLGLMTSCHFLNTRKLEIENVHLNQVFSNRLVIIFYLRFKSIDLQTLGGLKVQNAFKILHFGVKFCKWFWPT